MTFVYSSKNKPIEWWNCVIYVLFVFSPLEELAYKIPPSTDDTKSLIKTLIIFQWYFIERNIENRISDDLPESYTMSAKTMISITNFMKFEARVAFINTHCYILTPV